MKELTFHQKLKPKKLNWVCSAVTDLAEETSGSNGHLSGLLQVCLKCSAATEVLPCGGFRRLSDPRNYFCHGAGIRGFFFDISHFHINHGRTTGAEIPF